MITLLSRISKRSLVDAAALVIALWAAYLLRFEFAIPEEVLRSALTATPFVVVLQFVALRRYGIHRAVGRYLSFDDLIAFVWAAIFWLVPMLGVRILLPDGSWRIPVSVSLIDTVLALAGVLGVRWLQRMRAEVWNSTYVKGGSRKPVLLVGAGDAGVQVAHAIRRHDTGLRVVGFVDDDPGKDGAVIAGCQVIGTSYDIPRLVEALDIDHVIVTIVDAPPSLIQRIAGICETVPVQIRTVPGLLEIVRGSVSITKFRDIDVEDLLGRDPVDLDPEVLDNYLKGRVVMVTGSGGSIGSELARQVAASGPAKLLLVERFEGALFEIHRELVRSYPEMPFEPLVADVTDERRMRMIFAAQRPHVVIHAAAHKHVAMMEENSSEAVKNNTLGTQVVAELAGEFNAASFVLVSTDKAVRPSSVMGATKRLAEMLVQHYDRLYEYTRFIAVRFGNVLGSSGSVIPIFKDQLLQGGPVTVTHKDAFRYFMTIPEASRLVLTAGAIGEGGEIMVLDMGQPVRILDLAHNLIRLSGYAEGEIEVEFTGLKPGEKLSEELYSSKESMTLTRHRKIFIGTASGHDDIASVADRLRALVDTGDDTGLRQLLAASVQESQMSEAPSRGARSVGDRNQDA